MPDSETPAPGLAALRDLLDRGPITIDGLDDDDAARLVTMINAANDRQRAQLRAAVDGGMNRLPRLLRGPVKKALF